MQLSVPCLDLWTAFQACPGWETQLLCDGLHLTEQGNDYVYRLLQQLIDEQLPDLRVDSLPFDLPLHNGFTGPQDIAPFGGYLY